LLDDLRALVEFARTGSIAAAADRLFRTPSAITRQVQRLETALGVELLDRSVKPPRLNPLGAKVVEQARDLLQRAEALKFLASSDSEPTGLFRIGVAHALAEDNFLVPLQTLSRRYPKIRLRLLSELTGDLFNRLLAGELDVAAVLLPEGKIAPPPLTTHIVASDRMEIVEAPKAELSDDWKSLGAAPWVLNPPGCMLRASLLDQMDRASFAPNIAAEIHNMHLQLAFVRSGYGVGLLPARFVALHSPADAIRAVRPPGFALQMTIAIVRAGPLGALERAAELLEHELRRLFQSDELEEGTPPQSGPPRRCGA
jgi:DNA-binding transcriptional LysR family regulator